MCWCSKIKKLNIEAQITFLETKTIPPPEIPKLTGCRLIFAQKPINVEHLVRLEFTENITWSISFNGQAVTFKISQPMQLVATSNPVHSQ